MTVPVTRSTALVAAALDRNRYLFLQNPFYEVPNSSPKQVLDRVEKLNRCRIVHRRIAPPDPSRSGVFSNWKHTPLRISTSFGTPPFIIDRNGSCTDIVIHPVGRGTHRKGTHAYVWPLFRAWVDTFGWNLISNSLRAWGATFDQILSQFPYSTTGTGTQLLTSLGIDLAVVENEHRRRNAASYNPSPLRNVPIEDFTQIVEICSEAWGKCEPSVFEEIFVGRLIAEQYQAASGKSAIQDWAAFEPLLSAAVTSVGGRIMTHHLDGLRALLNADLVWSNARGTRTPWDQGCAGEMWCRAFLLCCLSTLRTRAFYPRVGINPEIKFGVWWQRIGTARGFWEAGGHPNPLSDCWTDVETIRQDTLSLASLQMPSYRDLLKFDARIGTDMTTFDRVGLVGQFA